MSQVTLLFLRHADTEKDPSKNAADWGLSPAGQAQAKEIASHPVLQRTQVIYTSSERKTALTVEPLANKLGLATLENSAFDEVRRGDKFLTPEEFAAEKRKQLEDLDYPAFDGETARQALQRFTAGVEQAVADHSGKTVLIVTHGTILNLFFASVLGVENELNERWKRTPFCAVGQIENGKVTLDITT